jgi:hypothetical protein
LPKDAPLENDASSTPTPAVEAHDEDHDETDDEARCQGDEDDQTDAFENVHPILNLFL